MQRSSLPTNETRKNLDKIGHVVVLMMENRSFDHMLGYLALEDVVPGVEGLAPGMGNDDPDGIFHEIAPLGNRLIHEKVLDPGHGAHDVRIQLAEQNSGFVRSYVAAVERNRRRHRWPRGLEFDPTLVLGYQTGADVPVYDFLARNYKVCDHWFSSVPGPTWPNRLFAVTGGSAGRVSPFVGNLPAPLRDAPFYDRPAFVRWLDDEAWRWYSHDPATLRMIDSRYRAGGDPGAGADRNFAYFNRRSLLERRSFLDDVERGRLPEVSWIDPNFVDFRLYGPPGSNDDHPPSRVMLGQELVLTVLTALARSKKVWEKTLLIITYDEHGGFYDHVAPGDFRVAGDARASYGVRVPALVVSPYVEAGVSHDVFDHTSIIKTILARFCDDPDQALAAVGPRTAAARDVGELLSRPADEPLDPPSDADLGELVATIGNWKLRAYRDQLLEEPHPGERLFEAITDLQGEIVAGSLALRAAGLRPGKP